MRAYYCINKNYKNMILVMTLKYSHNAQFFLCNVEMVRVKKTTLNMTRLILVYR